LFDALLRAIYNRSYHIKDIKQFLALTDLATYYCALPAVSRTLSNALHNSQDFIKEIPGNPCSVFEAAAKLRHEVLFREALIWVVGRWTQPHFTELADRRLRQVAKYAYGEVATMVSRSTNRIIDLALLATGPNYWSSDLLGESSK
jgi:hypothetical protein